jgi:hypothetical protein
MRALFVFFIACLWVILGIFAFVPPEDHSAAWKGMIYFIASGIFVGLWATSEAKR